MLNLGAIWNMLLVAPIFNLLMGFYYLIPNLGVAIILLTIAVRLVTLPITLKSIKMAKKQKDLMPELDKIKKKFKHDKKKQAEMQMELFKQHGINPASGCLTALPTIFIMIALYTVINMFVHNNSSVDSKVADLLYFDFLNPGSLANINAKFFMWDLTRPDKFFVLPLLAGVFQFVSSKMIMPMVAKAEKVAEKTPDKTDDIAYNMQQQMLFMMPLFTVMIGIKLPAGTVLYLVITSLYSMVQGYFTTGWGGLEPDIKKLKAILKRTK